MLLVNVGAEVPRYISPLSTARGDVDILSSYPQQRQHIGGSWEPMTWLFLIYLTCFQAEQGCKVRVFSYPPYPHALRATVTNLRVADRIKEAPL